MVTPVRSTDSGYAYGTNGSPQSTIEQAEYAIKVAENEAALDQFASKVEPDFNKAKVDAKNKLAGYALNPDHPVGKHKARVFKSARGFSRDDAAELERQILEKVGSCPAVRGKTDEYGTRYTVDIPIQGRNGRTVTVETGWIVRSGESTPNLVTAFVKKEG